MSLDYKLNKSELTRIKRQQKLYLQYLPLIKLKQEQLQLEENRIKKSIESVEKKYEQEIESLNPYLPFFNDSYHFSIYDFVEIKDIQTSQKIIAGITIKTFVGISFKDKEIAYFGIQPWLVESISLVKNFIALSNQLIMLKEEQKIIKRELKKAIQKVNLFEMMLIPDSKEAIKHIQIILGDEEISSVACAKMVKNKTIANEF